jgi:hypothetical protein
MSTTHRHFVAAFCRMLRGAAVATAMLALGLSIRAQSPKHPLDGSAGPEYWTATEVCTRHGAAGNLEGDQPKCEKSAGISCELRIDVPRECDVSVGAGGLSAKARGVYGSPGVGDSVSRNERYAAGDYPTQSKPEEGLPAWTKANRPIEDTDIALWYTVGFHDVPHAEDWPVMPTVWHESKLKPLKFFARNPALDLPKQLSATQVENRRRAREKRADRR